MGLSWWHIGLVLAAFVLLFGAGRISSLMGDIAKGLKSFNKAMAEGVDEQGGARLIEHEQVGKRPSRRSTSRKDTT